MSLRTLSALSDSCTAVVLPYKKDQVDFSQIAQLSGLSTQPDFQGKFQEILPLYHPTLDRKIFLVGLGTEKEAPKAADAFRSLAFHHQTKLQKDLSILLSHLPVEMVFQAALGLHLATYDPGRYKTEEKTLHPFLSEGFELQLLHSDPEAEEQATTGHLTADTQLHMMELVNRPANFKTPEAIAAYVRESAETYGYTATILEGEALVEAGFSALLAVGQGSAHPPVLIDMQYRSPLASSERPHLGLVGKGITFDTGGLSIKGAANMHYMKSDMGGAAAVIGAVELAARLKLPIHLRAVVPSAENSVDALSVCPSDVINSWSGKTIEIIDTDAEGRLVLADGLAYLQATYQPEILLDLATLTGSSVRTLGYAAGALFTNEDELANQLSEAGFRTHERLWRLPLWSDYEDMLHSDVADIRNFSGRPIAGAIAAAKFLEFFVKDQPRWAHMDIAGVAFGDSPYTKMKASTGYGVRLLVEFMRGLGG